MAGGRLLQEFRTALMGLTEADEGGELDAWGRRVWFTDADARLWAGLGCEASPPRCILLLERPEDEAYELLWLRSNHADPDRCPVVELGPGGDALVLTANLADYIDALIFTGGRAGTGGEDDLFDAREEASRAGLDLADALRDELDRDLADAEVLGGRCEAAQDDLLDAWSDAVEGV